RSPDHRDARRRRLGKAPSAAAVNVGYLHRGRSPDASVFVVVDLLGVLAAFVGVVLLGVAVGMLTGLSPGLHVNNVAALLLVPLRFVLSDPIELAARFRPWSALFLLGLLGAILATEFRGRHRIRRGLRAAWVQGLAGLLGILTLRGTVPLDPNIGLFPLFSGLFGLPTLFISLRGNSGRIPAQRIDSLRR